jgi:hypothetical protein
MTEPLTTDPLCADCGGFDVEWMRRCAKHGVEYCRHCVCPWCDEEAADDAPYFDEDFDPYEAIGESRFGLPGGGKSL